MPEISIKAESIFELFGFHITNSLILSLIVFLLFIIIAKGKITEREGRISILIDNLMKL